jgi:hypothetical protein
MKDTAIVLKESPMRRFALTTLIVMLTGLVAAAGCRHSDDDNPGNNNNNNSVTDDHTIYQVQDDSHPNHLQPGDLVEIEQVIVTAVDKYDSGDGRTGNVWVQEPEGGAFSGIQVFAPAILPGGSLDSIDVGDLVNVSGEIDEFALTSDTSGRTVTEIVNGNVTVLGSTDPLEPEVVSAQALIQDPDAEQWESVLVRVVNLRATDRDDQHNEVTFTGGLVGDDELWDLYGATTVDSCYSQVTGVMNYFFKYFLMPRSAADLVEGQPTDCASIMPEICDDGIDNNGNGFVDCDDWDCSNDPACHESNCGDGVDNDGDGDTDCDDSDCLGTVECPAPTENNDADCDDGIDNDGDNLVDCEDPSCHGHPDVTVCTETNCSDGVDNDLDGHTDCDDFDCLEAGACDSNPSVEAGVAACSDGVDNDGNGFTDCADNSCRHSVPACQEVTLAACTDGLDNDKNNHFDCDDFSCQYAGFCGEETSDASCSDGVDNDGDTYTDCNDLSCQRAPDNRVCEGNAVTCADGLDNDGDGHTDCADFSCRCCPGEGDQCSPGLEYAAPTCLRCTQ